MKITFLCFSAYLIFSGYSHSQWIYQPVPSNATHYLSIEFPNSTTGAVGGANSNNNFLGRGAYTTNSGNNWLNSQVPDSSRVLLDIEFINTATGFCAGAYNTVPGPVNGNIKYDKRTLQSIGGPFSSGIGFNYKGLFLKTTNSGQIWNAFGTLPSNVYYMLGISFISASTGYAIVSYDVSVGDSCGVIMTTNGGQSWSPLTLPENINYLHDINFVNSSIGFICGYDVVNDTSRAVVLRTTNSGVTWSRQVFMDSYEFGGINFSNSTTGLAVTFANAITGIPQGKVYRTTNTGVNWSAAASFNDVELQSVRFMNASGIALCFGTKYIQTTNKEFISRTTNYGSTWIESVLNDTGIVINDAELLTAGNWYLTGADFEPTFHPVILHTTNGGAIGITQISNEVPDRFSLEQNYPNPFNPATNIKFQVPNAGFVKLSVFDILGREIDVLVNENLKPGIYEASWDASNYPSGVYYYRLSTKDYSNTKKMILIK